MTRKEAIQRIKLILGIPVTVTTDPRHPDTVLEYELYEAMKDVVLDSEDYLEFKEYRLETDTWRYALPSNLLRMKSLHHLYNDRWRNVNRHDGGVAGFYNGFDPTDTDNIVSFYAKEPGTMRPTHYHGQASVENTAKPPVLIDYAANFGITDSGEEVDQFDYVFNKGDYNAIGQIHYVESMDWKIGDGASSQVCTAVSDATGITGAQYSLTDSSLADTMANLGVVVGDIISKDTDKTWGVIRRMTGKTVFYDRVHGSSSNFIALDYYSIGTGNKITLTNYALRRDMFDDLQGGEANVWDVTSVYTGLAGTYTATTFTPSGGYSAVSDTAIGDVIFSTTSGGIRTGGEITAINSTTGVLTIYPRWSHGPPEPNQTATITSAPTYIPSDAETASIVRGDEYTIEDRFPTLDGLLLKPVPYDSDAVGEASLRLYYYPMPELPLYDDDPLSLNQAYNQAVIANCIERAKMRETGKTRGYLEELEHARANRFELNYGSLGNTYVRPGSRGQGRMIISTDLSNL